MLDQTIPPGNDGSDDIYNSSDDIYKGDLEPWIEGISELLALSDQNHDRLVHFLAWLTLHQSLGPEIAAQVTGQWEVRRP